MGVRNNYIFHAYELLNKKIPLVWWYLIPSNVFQSLNN